ncbi:MAG TPA: choice-of-anchor tandem repeat GloVer-containing protein, partial [Bryobacteraceae bacterium]|nr:choice-of-anchor tandem repeat GloVer-containing protein [Bryobacteraceae bacterium]
AADNNFYGIGNEQPGGISPGFIFRLTPKGEYSKLLTFPKFSYNGILNLISASDGNLYGVFAGLGPTNSGIIYKATLSGQLQTVVAFPPSMAGPMSIMQAADGNLYGGTKSQAIFRYDMTAHTLTNAFQLPSGGVDGLCTCQLIQGMDGKLYGVTNNGGPWPGDGVVFSLDFGLPRPKPVVTALYPSAGAAGQQVMLWGKYLLAASSVTFNGAPATTIHITSEQSVSVTVPEDATSGPVTITTPNGTFTTTQPFTVQ